MKKIILLFCISIISLSFLINDKPTGLNTGDIAPDFIGNNQYGKSIHLKEELQKGSVVVLFYRGEWCPYCNKQIKNLEDSLALITDKGATIIAITPEKAENITKTIEKTKASFSIISDSNSKIMNDYKVSFELDEKTTEKYKSYGINLIEKNGNSDNKLPVPALYIIGKNGIISYRYFDENYSKRISVKEILAHL